MLKFEQIVWHGRVEGERRREHTRSFHHHHLVLLLFFFLFFFFVCIFHGFSRLAKTYLYLFRPTIIIRWCGKPTKEAKKASVEISKNDDTMKRPNKKVLRNNEQMHGKKQLLENDKKIEKQSHFEGMNSNKTIKLENMSVACVRLADERKKYSDKLHIH